MFVSGVVIASSTSSCCENKGIETKNKRANLAFFKKI
jgi:hypothetical protein